MSATVLEHPLVREYLRRLDGACAALPAGQARELREQIAGHLDEALPPGAGDAEVAAELARLGDPAALAAEAADTADAAGPGPRSPDPRRRNLLSRLRWRGWTSIAVVVAVVAAALTYVIVVQSAAPLSLGGLSAWWFPQDRDHGTMTTTVEGTQMSAPERYGQQQGFLIGVTNDSDWTQTIEGVDPNSEAELLPMTVSVGVGPKDGDGSYSAQTTWVLPGSIPPHSYRVMRVLWTSNVCQIPGNKALSHCP
jgi:hypothetical protein